jgi:hypothetical protein
LTTNGPSDLKIKLRLLKSKGINPLIIVFTHLAICLHHRLCPHLQAVYHPQWLQHLRLQAVVVEEAVVGASPAAAAEVAAVVDGKNIQEFTLTENLQRQGL